MLRSEFSRAHELFNRGDYGGTMEICREVRSRDPEDLDANYFIGRVQTEQGKAPLAALILQRVATHRDEDPTIHASLGRARRLAGDLDAAIASLQRAVALDPALSSARTELVRAYLAARDSELALEHAEAALRSNPGDATAHAVYALALLQEERADEARAAFARAVQLDATVAGSYRTEVVLHRAHHDLVAAARTLEAAVFFTPDDAEARHMLAAVGGDAAPERAADEYIEQHFDRFADRFDETLRGLKYNTPADLVGMLLPLLSRRAGDLIVLDAGCGTGLGGPLLRPYACRLEGVDLSAGMLDRARRLGVYDELVKSELTGFLGMRRRSYDVILAADVFIYFGDLTQPLGLIASSLRPGGVIAFSVEVCSGEAHVLNDSGRWAHSAAHLGEAADAAGLDLQLSPTQLRLEFDRPVEGLLGLGVLSPGRAAAANA